MAGYQTVVQRNLTCAVRIRERRRQLGLTQAEVVDRVNGQGSRLSNQALSAIENGRRLAVGRLPDLAAALHCTVSYLLGLTADPDRWEPDDPAPEAEPRPGLSGGRASPGMDGAHPGRPVPPPRSWILGPDVPDIPFLLDPSRRLVVSVVAHPEHRLAGRADCGRPAGHNPGQPQPGVHGRPALVRGQDAWPADVTVSRVFGTGP